MFGKRKEGEESRDPLGTNFDCKVIHTFYCLNCKQKSTLRPQLFRDFSLEISEDWIQDASDIQRLLQIHFQVKEKKNFLLETFFYNQKEDRRGKKCDTCQSDGDHRFTHFISKLPRILVLHLKRFQATVKNFIKIFFFI